MHGIGGDGEEKKNEKYVIRGKKNEKNLGIEREKDHLSVAQLIKGGSNGSLSRNL